MNGFVVNPATLALSYVIESELPRDWRYAATYPKPRSFVQCKDRCIHGRHQASCKKLRNLHQGRAALPEADEARAGALQPAAVQGLRRMRGGPRRKAGLARRSLVALDPIRHRFRAALDPVLGHAAPARQQLRRAQPRRDAAGAALRVRDGRRRAQARAAGQLRAGADRPAGGRRRSIRSAGPT